MMKFIKGHHLLIAGVVVVGGYLLWDKYNKDKKTMVAAAPMTAATTASFTGDERIS